MVLVICLQLHQLMSNVSCFGNISWCIVKSDVLLDASEFVEIRPSNPVGVKGQSITLICFAVGNPSPDYEWRGGKSATGSTLKLTSLEFKDEGTYTCVANNTIEGGTRSTNTSVQLTIEGIVLFTLICVHFVCLVNYMWYVCFRSSTEMYCVVSQKL